MKFKNLLLKTTTKYNLENQLKILEKNLDEDDNLSRCNKIN